MPRSMSFDRVCCPKAVMSCHARPCRLYVLFKGSDVMPRPDVANRVCCPRAGMSFHGPTSSDRVCSQRAVMSCHARCRSTVCAIQRRGCHATPDVVRLCVLSKGGDVMPRLTSLDRVFFKGGDGMPRLTSSDRACGARAVMVCHA